MTFHTFEDCKKYEELGYKFINTNDRYVDDEGVLNSKYNDDNCHIRDPVFVSKWLKENL